MTNLLFSVSPAGFVVAANKQFIIATGYNLEELTKKSFIELWHNEDRKNVLTCLENAISGNSNETTILRLLKNDENYLNLEITPSSMLLQGNITEQIMFSCKIVEQSAYEHDIIFACHRLHLFAENHSVDELLEEALSEIETITGSKIAFCHFVNEDQISLTLQNWWKSTKMFFCKAEGKGEHYDTTKPGVWADCIHTKKPVIHNDYESLLYKKDNHTNHIKVVRELVVPIIKDNKFCAILGIGNKQTNYTQQDVEITSFFAEQFWKIAENKRLQEELLKSEDNFRAIFNNSSTATLVINTDSTIAMVNEEACRISGYTKEELCGKKWLELIHPDSHAWMIENYQKRMNKLPEVVSKYECKGYHKTGKVINLMLSVSETKDNILVVTLLDNTAQKQAEDKLHKIILAVEHSPATIVITDTKGNIEYVNPKFTEVTGYTYNEAIGNNPRILKSLETNPTVYDYLWKTIVAGNEWRGELLNKKKNGDLFWESVVITPVKNELNEIINFIAVKEDITQRKFADEILRKSEQKFAMAFNLIPVPLMIVDIGNQLIVDVNEAFTKKFGYERESTIGLKSIDLGLWVDVKAREKYVNELITKREIRSFETQYYLKNGEIRDFLLSSKIIEYDGRQCSLSFNLDITDIKKVQNEIVKSEHKFSTAFHLIPISLLIIDIETGKIIDVNEAFVNKFGFQRKELIGATTFDLNIWEDNIERQRYLDHLNITGQIKNYETKFRLKNGEVIDILRSSKVIEYDGKKCSLSFNLDITESKKIHTELFKSEEKFAKAFKTNPVPFVLTSIPDGLIIDVNDVFLATTGFTKEEVVGKTTIDLNLWITPKDRQNYFKELKQKGLVNNFEISYRMKNGVIRDFLHSNQIIELEGKKCSLNFLLDISESKKAREATKKSEDKFSKAFNASPILMAIITLKDGKILDVNDTFCKTTGYSKEETIGYTTIDLNLWIEPNDRLNYVASLQKSASIREWEFKFRIRSGEIKDFLMSSEIVELDGEKCSVNLIMDVSENIKAKELIVKSEEKFAKIFNTSPLLILITQIGDGRVYEANNAFFSVTGFTKEEVIGKTAIEINYWQSENERQIFLSEFIKTYSIRDYEINFKMKSGEIRTFLISSESIELEEKKCAVNILRDITERKRSEELIRQNELQFGSILHTAMDGIWLVDSKGYIIQANETYSDMSGYSTKEMIGMHITQFDTLETKAETEKRIKKIIETGENRFESKHRHKNGSTFDVEISAQYTNIGDGRFVVFIRNITERKQIEQRLKEDEEKLKTNLSELKYKNTQLTDFCNIVSHNLRGPIVNIDMLVSFIESSEDDDERTDLFSKVKSVLGNLNETFNELVESLQVKQETELKVDKIVLHNYVLKIKESLHSEIITSGAILEIDFEEVPVIHYPSKYINSILHNLISNAIKYKADGRKPLIKIITKKINDNIILSVTDNGLGLDLNKHGKNLFKIRKTFHQHPNAKGFGLFMTKTQVEAMGGKIWAESNIGEGTTFFIEIKNNGNEKNS